eukprot:TRINITY_DN7070_c0_g1_i1.p1 TRINITY_DN7070_c0_g1~~TRINITY_DN7070_c0_g1_i1.p1  ORF type:complete len:323 (+),score=11.74 TRINITY_DN7070_c0_g1_i1:3-971(+)
MEVPTLPEEIYYLIFTFTTWQQVGRLACCNRMFHRLASAPALKQLLAPQVASVSKPEKIATMPPASNVMYAGYGTFVRDSEHVGGPDKWYAVEAYGDSLRSYDQLLPNIAPTGTIRLPFKIHGTSAVLRSGIFYYCARSATRNRSYSKKFDSPVRLIAFDLRNNRIAAERELIEAAYDNDYSLAWGGCTYVQLCLDELGLWMIYTAELSTDRSEVRITRIDPVTLEPNEPQCLHGIPSLAGYGLLFMVYGVVYFVHKYNLPMTQVILEYDVKTRQQISASIPFYNSADDSSSYNCMVSYNHFDGCLYSVNQNAINRYTLTFN